MADHAEEAFDPLAASYTEEESHDTPAEPMNQCQDIFVPPPFFPGPIDF